jgi:hypothetical protein
MLSLLDGKIWTQQDIINNRKKGNASLLGSKMIDKGMAQTNPKMKKVLVKTGSRLITNMLNKTP